MVLYGKLHTLQSWSIWYGMVDSGVWGMGSGVWRDDVQCNGRIFRGLMEHFLTIFDIALSFPGGWET